MRSTIVKGIDDGIRIDLGGDVSIICEVMEIGRCVDYLIYEAEMTGAELAEFMKKFHIAEDIYSEVKAENRYIIRSYDW